MNLQLKNDSNKIERETKLHNKLQISRTLIDLNDKREEEEEGSYYSGFMVDLVAGSIYRKKKIKTRDSAD